MNAPHALTNVNPWMANNDKKCETTGLVLTKFHQSNYLASNNFCRMGFSKLILATKRITVITIKLLYHATCSQINKYYG